MFTWCIQVGQFSGKTKLRWWESFMSVDTEILEALLSVDASNAFPDDITLKDTWKYKAYQGWIKDGKSKAVEKEDNNIKPVLFAIHKVQLDALQLPAPRKSNSKSSEVTIYVFPQKSTYTTKQNFHHHRILVWN